MTKEDLITVLQTIIDALKEPPVTQESQQQITIPVQQAAEPAVTQQCVGQPPATSWDILRQNQQQLAALQQELSNLKMGGITPNPYSMVTYPQMQPVVNPNNIGGNFQ